MKDCLKELEYYSKKYQCFIFGEIIGIENSEDFLMKSDKDSEVETCNSKDIRKITKISNTPLEDGICEYIKNKDEFIEVEIKEQKGFFYILECENDNEIKTILSKKNQIRYIETTPIEDYIEKNNFVNLELDLPSNLVSWTQSERFQEVLKPLTVDENENNFFYTCFDSDSEYKLRILCDKEKKDLTKLLLESAFEKEQKLSSIHQDKENSKKQLEDVLKKNKIFYLNKEFIGLAIGKEGANLKRLKEKYNVNIILDSKHLNDKQEAKVTISGDDGDNVDACAKELNITSKIYKIPDGSYNDFKKRALKLCEMYNLKSIFVMNEDSKDNDASNIEGCKIRLTGNIGKIEELYNKEIKDYGEHGSGNSGYNNYNTGSYRGKNKGYNNYRGYNNDSYKHNNSGYYGNNNNNYYYKNNK